MLDAIKPITDVIFFFHEDNTFGAHALCVQHSPTAVALSTSFLLNHAPQQPRAECIDCKI